MFQNPIDFFKLKNFKNKLKKKSSFTYNVPTPEQIRESINKMSSCPKCHFIVFENYWYTSSENIKMCPTCGHKSTNENKKVLAEFGL